MAHRWSVDADLEDELRALLALGTSPARAIDRLSSNEAYRGRLPSLRTVQRIAREVRPSSSGERWSFAAADPEEARLVLPVLAAVGEGYGTFSRGTVAWLVRIRIAAPELGPRDAFLWAIRYQAAAASGKDTAALDQRLAREASRPASPSSS
jgi:hypothetical protein